MPYAEYPACGLPEAFDSRFSRSYEKNLGSETAYCRTPGSTVAPSGHPPTSDSAFTDGRRGRTDKSWDSRWSVATYRTKASIYIRMKAVRILLDKENACMASYQPHQPRGLGDRFLKSC